LKIGIDGPSPNVVDGNKTIKDWVGGVGHDAAQAIKGDNLSMYECMHSIVYTCVINML